MVIVRTSQSKSEKQSLDNMAHVRTIRVESEFKTVKKVLGEINTSYTLVKNKKRIKGGVFFDDFIKEVQSKTYPTNHGFLSVEQIAKYGVRGTGKNIILMAYPNKDLAEKIYATGEAIHVITEEDDLFEIAVWCTHNGIGYTLWERRTKLCREDSEVKIFEWDSLDWTLDHIIGDYAQKRNKTVYTGEHYVDDGCFRHDTISVLLTILDGIRSIDDGRVLDMFIEAMKPIGSMHGTLAYDRVKIAQKHLDTAKSISRDLNRKASRTSDAS